MLERPGDLIPILPEAAQLPWTRRRSQVRAVEHGNCTWKGYRERVLPENVLPMHDLTVLTFFFQILNFLHRGPVTFSTLVYDTNVGDISTLSCYFNQERISVEELNSK